MIKQIILITYSITIALGSDNGGYYTCDTAILETDNQCIFDLTGKQNRIEQE